MKKAAEEEYRFAIEKSNVHEDGIRFITVLADGSWCKKVISPIRIT